MAADLKDGVAWINGDYVPIAEARIPILDWGLTRSDLTYDVVGVWNGNFFRLDDHLDRFERSCRLSHLSPPVSRDQMREILTECVSRAGLDEAYVEMVTTRGVPPAGARDPRTFKQTFYAFAIPYVWIVRRDLQEAGTHVVVARDTRRTPPDAMDPTVKNFQWGDFIRGLFEAYERDAWLPILTDGDGNVTEGPGFNVFALVDGALHTPVQGVLQGITRMTVLDIAEEEAIPVRVELMPVGALYRADEIFLTSTAGGIMPVTTLDGQPVGSGKPGRVTRRISELYWAWHDDPRFATRAKVELTGA